MEIGFQVNYSLFPYTKGAVAQLGERLVRNQKVSGSIPLSSINKINHLRRSARFFAL